MIDGAENMLMKSLPSHICFVFNGIGL